MQVVVLGTDWFAPGRTVMNRRVGLAAPRARRRVDLGLVAVRAQPRPCLGVDHVRRSPHLTAAGPAPARHEVLEVAVVAAVAHDQAHLAAKAASTLVWHGGADCLHRVAVGSRPIVGGGSWGWNCPVTSARPGPRSTAAIPAQWTLASGWSALGACAITRRGVEGHGRPAGSPGANASEHRPASTTSSGMVILLRGLSLTGPRIWRTENPAGRPVVCAVSPFLYLQGAKSTCAGPLCAAMFAACSIRSRIQKRPEKH